MRHLAAAPPKPKLGIRAHDDTTLQINMAMIPPEMQKVFQYIDDHIDEHVENLQKWVQQPSVSISGEGIPESAEMVKGFFEKLGCQETRVYDVGMTEVGKPGNPVVYARCDEGAPKTLAVYWMYDTMPITQPDAWSSPPFEAKIVDAKVAEVPNATKVLIGRGATNSKGPEMVELNALMSMKAVMGHLPVNLIFVAEGDEERLSIGLRKFVKEHRDLLTPADAFMMFAGQNDQGFSTVRGGSEGCLFIELSTSGKSWGRGPIQSDIHGINMRSVDSPAWRHAHMLASLTSLDGNTPLIQGFNDGIEPLDAEDKEMLKKQAAKIDIKQAAKNLGVGRFIADNAEQMVSMARYHTAFDFDGVWGGNMFAGGSGSILPNKITSKHSIRYLPNQHGSDIVKKIRAQLDRNGYKDVELTVIGDDEWSKMQYDTDIAHAVEKTYDAFNIPYQKLSKNETILAGGNEMGGAWPGYMFTNGPQGDTTFTPVGLPIAGGGAGGGGRAHAADEYYVIEGAGKRYGIAGGEKSIAMVMWNFAHTTTTTPKSELNKKP
ncbi:M20/M25/M40 family metallo-hydrolase [Granulicella sp. WH15]|uniref:M20/M25/M40 family metallo-hydrolase n=1 Tax=Granulicella sp. WH15 TaxID=2602070 RepID=UPI0013A54D23|nr:M20/M25/M40 family metallo-hydrolase [Granulicella sp. WH15]